VSTRRGGIDDGSGLPWCYARRCKLRATRTCPAHVFCGFHLQLARTAAAGAFTYALAAQDYRRRVAWLRQVRDIITPRVALTADERRVKRAADRAAVGQALARLVAELGGDPATTHINFGDAAARAEHPRRPYPAGPHIVRLVLREPVDAQAFVDQLLAMVRVEPPPADDAAGGTSGPTRP
jgi:hypothetical protein